MCLKKFEFWHNQKCTCALVASSGSPRVRYLHNRRIVACQKKKHTKSLGLSGIRNHSRALRRSIMEVSDLLGSLHLSTSVHKKWKDGMENKRKKVHFWAAWRHFSSQALFSLKLPNSPGHLQGAQVADKAVEAETTTCHCSMVSWVDHPHQFRK